MVVRRVAAILALDVVSYSRRMADDELATLALLHRLKTEVLYPAFQRWNGRVFKEMGDGILAEFASVVHAVECANDIQVSTGALDPGEAEPLRMRIGIHFGEVVAEGDDLFGDTVNIAARIESMADSGGVWLSEQARQVLGNRVKLEFRSKGPRTLKNIPEPVTLFALVPGGTVTAKTVADADTPAEGRPSRRTLAGVGAAALVVGLALAYSATRPEWATVVNAEQPLPGDLSHTQVFRDCETCPEMVAIAEGRLLMGAPPEGIKTGEFAADQGPQRLVSVGAFAVGRFEVTREEYATFLSQSDHLTPSGCRTWEDGSSSIRPDRSFDDPGYEQDDRHPAVCLSWHDAQAYADWLSRKTGQSYRLLSEAEWEYVARAGADTRYFFGADGSEVCAFDNTGDATARSRWPDWQTSDCSDGRIFTAPVGSYRSNPFGVFDLYGNVREWVRDCWHNTLEGGPETAAPWVDPSCEQRVVRGGSWDSKPSIVSSSWRGRLPADHRDFLYGFRVARDLTAR